MDHIGQYRILKKLGAGGMGTVLLGEHILLGRRAAIKTLRPELLVQSEIVERFFNEARATSAIADPGVVQIYDFGYSVDGTAYIVMELLEGEGLGARIARLGRLPVADTLRIARQVASSLAAAHAHDIIHRDLKPDNVFLIRDAEVDGGERAKVFDFGICKRACDPLLTLPDTMLGTPIYMSPEQCRGTGPVDHRADIYALGCVMFEMLVGEPPFSHDGLGEVIAAHMLVDPPRPSSRHGGELRGAHANEIVDLVDALVVRCLAKSPDDRFASMADLISAIEAVDGELAALERPIPYTFDPLLDSVTTLGPGTPVIEPSHLDLLHAREREQLATCIFGASRDDEGVVVTDLAPHMPTVIGVGVAHADAPAPPPEASRPPTGVRRPTPPRTNRSRRSRAGSVRGSRKLLEALAVPERPAHAPQLRPEDLEGPRFLRASDDEAPHREAEAPPREMSHSDRWFAEGDAAGSAPQLRASAVDRWVDHDPRWSLRRTFAAISLGAVGLVAMIGVYFLTRDALASELPRITEQELAPAPPVVEPEDQPAAWRPTARASEEVLEEPAHELQHPAAIRTEPERDTWFGPLAPSTDEIEMEPAAVREPVVTRTQAAPRRPQRQASSSANPAGSVATTRYAGAVARHASMAPRVPSGATQGRSAPVMAPRPPSKAPVRRPPPDGVLANPWTDHPNRFPTLKEASASRTHQTEDLYEARW